MLNYTKVRVRYSETDQMGVVYYANYFVWMEVGRTNLLRNTGITYRELEEKGYALPVLYASAKFYSPAYYDDEINIVSAIIELKGAKLKIGYKIYRDETLLCEGITEHAFLSKETKKPVKPPLEILKWKNELNLIEKDFLEDF